MTRCKACDDEIDYGSEDLCDKCLRVVFEDIASDEADEGGSIGEEEIVH